MEREEISGGELDIGLQGSRGRKEKRGEYKQSIRRALSQGFDAKTSNNFTHVDLLSLAYLSHTTR